MPLELAAETLKCLECILEGKEPCESCDGLKGLVFAREIKGINAYFVDWDVYGGIKSYLEEKSDDFEPFLQKINSHLEERSIFSENPKNGFDRGGYLLASEGNVLNPRNVNSNLLYFSRFDDALYYSQLLKPKPILIAHVEAQLQ